MDRTDRNRRIDHVALPSADLVRSRAFHGAPVGWTFTGHGPAGIACDEARLGGGVAHVGRVTPAAGGAALIPVADDPEATRTALAGAGRAIVTGSPAIPGVRRFRFAAPGGRHARAVRSER